MCVCQCVQIHVFHDCPHMDIMIIISTLTSSPITNEGSLDKSTQVMLVLCSDMIG